MCQRVCFDLITWCHHLFHGLVTYKCSVQGCTKSVAWVLWNHQYVGGQCSHNQVTHFTQGWGKIMIFRVKDQDQFIDLDLNCDLDHFQNRDLDLDLFKIDLILRSILDPFQVLILILIFSKLSLFWSFYWSFTLEDQDKDQNLPHFDLDLKFLHLKIKIKICVDWSSSCGFLDQDLDQYLWVLILILI